MRVKEFEFKIKSHPMYAKYVEYISMPYEQWRVKWEERRVFTYRMHQRPDDYSQGLSCYIREKWRKEIPELHLKYKFKFGVWGDVTAFVHINTNEYGANGEIRKSLGFHFHDLNPKIMWNLKFELPDHLNLSNPIWYFRQALRKYFFEEGVIGECQKYYNEDKKWAIWHYKHLRRDEGYIDEAQIFRIIKKRFNCDSYLSLEATISLVNRNGAFAKMTKVEKYDHSWIFDFDGDMDELEQEYWNTIEDNTLYI